jgi:valyl-tRNA synthetase
MMNLCKAEIPAEINASQLTDADKWIVSKSNDIVKEVTDNLESFELGIALQKVYDFIWEEFCDWYIEMVKPRLYNDEDETKSAALWTLKHVLITSLKLLHPFMPFITDEIYMTLREMSGDDGASSIMVSDWPKFREDLVFAKEAESIGLIKDAVSKIRNIRSEMNVPPSKKVNVYVVSESEKVRWIFEDSTVFFAALGHANQVIVQEDKSSIADDAASAIIPGAMVFIPFAELVDIEKEIERLLKEKERLEGELKRVDGLLSNPNFISKAPQSKLEEERKKQQKYSDMMKQVLERLEHLKQ